MLKETLAALNLTVEVDGVTHEVRLKPGDMVRFEQHFGRSLFTESGEVAFGVTELSFLAFAALRRTKVFDGDFDAFVDVLDDVTVTEGQVPKAV